MDFLPQFASYRVKVYLILFALSVATACISIQVYSIDDFSSAFTKSVYLVLFALRGFPIRGFRETEFPSNDFTRSPGFRAEPGLPNRLILCATPYLSEWYLLWMKSAI
jgi:hypothetical protein